MALPLTLPSSRWSTLLWLPLNLLQALFTALWSAVWISVALLLSALAGPGPALALARSIWAPAILAGAGVRLVVDREAAFDFDRARMYVANHQSWIDIPVLLRALPVPLYFLAKRELTSVPLLGWYIRAMGMVFVERTGQRRATESIGRAGALLATGRSVFSFPEGTRSRDGRLGRFKHGGFGAALEAGVEIVPIGILGSGSVLPAGGFRVRPGRIEVRVGTPISTADFAQDDRAGVARAVEAEVARLSGR